MDALGADERRVAELAAIVRSGNIQGLRSMFAEMSDESDSSDSDTGCQQRPAAATKVIAASNDLPVEAHGSHRISRGKSQNDVNKARGKPGLNWNTTIDDDDEEMEVVLPTSRQS
mgnify:CR=1 FL=1